MSQFPFDARPDPLPLTLWQRILQSSPDHYDLSRRVEQEQQVYRENRVARYCTPHLLDQAFSLVRVSGLIQH